MLIEKIKTKQLIPAEYNPRKDLKPGDPEYEKLKRSLEEFGYVEPIIVNYDMTVIGGHQRLTVLKDLGYTEVQCVEVHIEDENIATDNAYIYIEAELARASKQAIETLGEKDIYHIFTPLMPNTSTRIILKKPKTDSSIRKVWLPKTVAY